MSSQAQTASEDVAQLPTPTGPYAIGTALYDWTDPSREEQWEGRNADGRELMVQLWYPAHSTAGQPTAPYIPDFERLRPSLNQDWPRMPAFKTHAVLNAPLSSRHQRYPVLIFSHGMNSARFFYTALLEDLASHGYIVAAIDHSYWGPSVAFSDGRTIPYEKGMDALDKLTSDEIHQMMWAGVSVMLADEVFVHKQLESLNADSRARNSFRNHLDMSRVGALGHSMGGRAATRACLEYSAFKACASLDGHDQFLYLRPTSSEKHFLLLVNSTWGTSVISPSLAKRYLAAWKSPEVFVVKGTKHNSFDDLPLLNPEERSKAPSDPVKAFQVIAVSVLTFFNLAFGYETNSPMDPIFLQNVTPVDLKQLATNAK